MQASPANTIWIEYHKSYSKQNTLKAYLPVLSNFLQGYREKNLKDLTSEENLSFLKPITEGTGQQTKRTRYSHLTACFNFIINNIDHDFRNPCEKGDNVAPILEALSGHKKKHY